MLDTPGADLRYELDLIGSVVFLFSVLGFRSPSANPTAGIYRKGRPLETVLVCDDDPQIRNLLSRMLEGKGYHVLTASDGQKGIYLAELEPVDLIITDILMPAKDGLETIRELRREDRKVKIIAISGGTTDWDDLGFLPTAKRFGADAILAKPFTSRQLLDLVRDVLDRQHQSTPT